MMGGIGWGGCDDERCGNSHGVFFTWKLNSLILSWNIMYKEKGGKMHSIIILQSYVLIV